jgi:hypothetical protein
MILEIINTMAILIASVVAIYGIDAWKKEFSGKRRIELAEDILALFYEAKDIISAVRSPFGFQGEGSTRKPQEGETPQQKQVRDRAYVVYERFEKGQEVFNKLHSKRYQFMARFGTDKIKPFEELRRIEIEIAVFARALERIWERGADGEESEKRKYEAVIWEKSEDDEINTRLKKVISDIEAICRPIILGKKTN